MSAIPSNRTSDLIETIANLARRRLSGPEGEAVAAFAALYYARVPYADIAERDPAALMGAALAHRRFGARRAAGTAKVRAYNPTLGEHGWKSEHTVIEIVNDDMPFLVDSISAELHRRQMEIFLLVHPVVESRRDGAGEIEAVAAAGTGGEGVVRESFLHVQVNRQSTSRLAELAEAVERVLADVRGAVTDFRSMRERMAAAVDELRQASPRASADPLDEVLDFLDWAAEKGFTFLGYRMVDLATAGGKVRMAACPGSELGVLRVAERPVFRDFVDGENLHAKAKQFLCRPEPLFVAKTDWPSSVHRAVLADAIAVRRFDAKGKVTGLHLFVGLFTSLAYTRSPHEIPLLRARVMAVVERAGLPADSHDGRALLNILESFPRDELFQVSGDHLSATATGVLNLQDRRRAALFIRRDELERFMSCLIYVPRDRYDTDLRQRMQAILEAAFGGGCADWYTTLGDDPMARCHMFIRTTPGAVPEYDPATIEAALSAAARSWSDHLRDALIAAHGEETGHDLFQRYQGAFEAGYRDRFDADAAVDDIERIEKALANDTIAMSLRHPIEAAEHQIRLKLYNPDSAVPLSNALPVLEHLGFRVIDEVPFPVRPEGAPTSLAMIHDFGLETRDRRPIDISAVRDTLLETLRRVWRGDLESDGFNALAVSAELGWREIWVLQAVCKYLRQAGIPFSQAYMEQTLGENPELASKLIALFHARFDLSGEGNADAVVADIREALNAVANADQDRIIRRFMNVIQCMQRTNFHQTDDAGNPKPYLSFKLDSQGLTELPLPRPLVEIFVHSPRMEGVHLRGGRVARGGIRWSDRREDFRTEVLGLMKAQMVKNAVIVPVGSKGGFVLKHPPAPGDREAMQAEGIACYSTLMHGMFDITDNRVGDGIVPPVDVIRHDADDPYLVVAADKGTATFSDIANAISVERGFWLRDAFASGGSQGYDHKKMGITARGAWESVKRHFRETGRDIQSEDFTVVGVGDMSGDVFGNGMLLSPHIRLIAAFNHLHVFLDPDPDPAVGLAERRRLFEKPRSTWADYDAALLSAGGGVFPRTAKMVPLSPEVRARFGIEEAELPPNDLIRRLLTAEVDLLWFGGIGTYVKASTQSNADAGDRANDGVRVNADALHCRVVGEGANLGVTQRGRIEYALCGGRINTDSIDNSAGVDTSDHEVNIKVLLDAIVDAGDMTEKQRNTLLARMTDEVGELVVRNNYLQTQAISVAEAKGGELLDEHARVMTFLEREKLLDRAVEFLPDTEAIEERAATERGLTRPELAILLSYGKLWLYDRLLETDLPEDPRLLNDLVRYFPTPLRENHRDAVVTHRLRREIITTVVTNSIVNRAGAAFVPRMVEETGDDPATIARAYMIARKVFDLRAVWAEIEALDVKVPAGVQISMHWDTQRLLERATMWFLRHAARPLDIDVHVEAFRAGTRQLNATLERAMPPRYFEDLQTRARPLIDEGVPETLALHMAANVNLISFLDIVRIADRRKLPVEEVSRLYFAIGGRFRFGSLRAAAEKLTGMTHWQKLATDSLVDELYRHQTAVTDHVLYDRTADNLGDALADWMEQHSVAVGRTDRVLEEIWNSKIDELAIIAVAARQIGRLTDARHA